MIRRFHNSYRIVNNHLVPDSSAEPPETLAVAEQQFKFFLTTNRYPSNVCWITSCDVAFCEGQFFVKQTDDMDERDASERYAVGVAKGLGVELRAICADDRETFATIYVPSDEQDAKYHLIGRSLKLSCPTSRRTAKRVRNRLKWLILRTRDRGRSRSLLE